MDRSNDMGRSRESPNKEVGAPETGSARGHEQGEPAARASQPASTRHDDDSARHERDPGERTRTRSHTSHERDRVADRGISWSSVVLGWLAATGAGAILAGIVSAIVGTILGVAQNTGAVATESGMTGLIGGVITLFLAFLIGGYCAGRLASRAGSKHGLLVPVLALIVGIIVAILGALFGAGFIDTLSGFKLPKLSADFPQSLGTILSISGILALLAPFIGGALGGLWGAKTGRHRP